MIWHMKAESACSDVEQAAAQMLPAWLVAERGDGFGLPLLSGLFFSSTQSDEEEQPHALETDHIFSKRVTP